MDIISSLAAYFQAPEAVHPAHDDDEVHFADSDR